MDWDRKNILDPRILYRHHQRTFYSLEPTIYLSHASLKDILGSMDLWYCVAQLVETAMPMALLPWLAAGEYISGACYKQR